MDAWPGTETDGGRNLLGRLIIVAIVASDNCNFCYIYLETTTDSMHCIIWMRFLGASCGTSNDLRSKTIYHRADRITMVYVPII